MKSLHLFAGIGGGILADAILGHKVVGAVEIVPYCRTILRQHQEDGFLPPFPVFEDVRTFDYEQYVGKIDLVCGGFPCQDISAAGAGRGLQGSKSRLFYELVRVCNGIRPRFIFLENSPRITGRGLDSVLKEIASIGYDAEWTTLSAGKCGAPHLRDRWWCLCRRQDVSEEVCRGEVERVGQYWKSIKERSVYGRPTANTEMLRCKETMPGGFETKEPKSGFASGAIKSGWWATKPRVGRLVNEFPSRVDALKGLGNAQVPVTAALAFFLLLRRFC